MRRVSLGPGAILGNHQKVVVGARLTRLAVRARISGPLAAVEVVQTFTNDGEAALEMAYLFPLSEQATLTRFCAQGARRLEGQVTESSSDQPLNPRPAFLNSYFEGEQAPVLCVGLGVVEPGQTITVELAYAELLAGQRFAFPLSPTLESCHFTVVAEADEVACNHVCQLSRLPSLEWRVELLELRSQEDFTLTLKTSPQTLVRQSARHFMLQVSPPPGPLSPHPRTLVILLDGSENARAAGRFEQAKQVVHRLLTSMREGEQFALVVFNHEIDGYQMGAFQPTQQACQALAWLEGWRPRGRADAAVLFERVLSLPGAPSVVLIACGPVGNEPELYARVCAQPHPPRFFTVGLTQEVNPAFLRRLASVTRGSAYLGPPGDELLEDTHQPWLCHLTLTDQGLAPVSASLVPTTLPHLTRRGVCLMGLKQGQGTLKVWQETADSRPCQNPALPVLWASRKVAEMLDELKLISGPRASQMRQISLDLCREYRLLTELTSFSVGGAVLPSLYPRQWPDDPAPVTEKLPSQRIQLKVPEVMAEPRRVRAGLISPEKNQHATGGLCPKLPRQKNTPAKRTPAKPAFKNMGAVLVRARKHQVRQLLAQSRLELINDLRLLYRTQELAVLERALRRLQPLQGRSEILDEVYRLGLLCYRDLRAGHPKAAGLVVKWVQRFAGFF